MIARLRARAGGGLLGSVLACFYCSSVWVAAPLALLLGASFREKLLLWPALSGAAILLERATKRSEAAPPAVYREDREEDDVMLRK
ncbi:DUF1360 domain-containing protein [Sorangium sp. So ce1153]|uniref:DUF1360 domain-containing protein n=1 Tax=Sorangium sp. So ce1153 TaxID=3133333 RepID=UPI003F61737C